MENANLVREGGSEKFKRIAGGQAYDAYLYVKMLAHPPDDQALLQWPVNCHLS